MPRVEPTTISFYGGPIIDTENDEMLTEYVVSTSREGGGLTKTEKVVLYKNAPTMAMVTCEFGTITSITGDVQYEYDESSQSYYLSVTGDCVINVTMDPVS